VVSYPGLILACAIPLAFFSLGFIVGCFEKRRVRMFESGEVPSLPPYLQAMTQDAIERGCTFTGTGYHTKYKQKLCAVLMFSADRRAMIVVGEGTIANLPYKQTMLISRFRNGAFLFTVDLVGAAELDPLTQRQILMKADFGEMIDKHSARLEEGNIPVPFASDADWSALDQIYRTRVDRMVKADLARYVDADREIYCYSIWGSFRATILHGLGQIFRPTNFARHYKRSPG
jgi:hypothetical protein